MLAALQVEQACLTVRAQSDWPAHGDLIRARREPHARIEGNRITRPSKTEVTAADKIAHGLAVDPHTQTDGETLLRPQGVAQAQAPGIDFGHGPVDAASRVLRDGAQPARSRQVGPSQEHKAAGEPT